MTDRPPVGATAAVFAGYLARLMEGARLPLGGEKAAQAALAERLDAAGVRYAREYRLSDTDIVDFMINADFELIAIELKVKGARREIRRQCERYCAHESVGALVLGTSVAMALPATINGKPCVVASLGVGWL